MGDITIRQLYCPIDSNVAKCIYVNMVDYKFDSRARNAIELMYFSYRAFTARADQVLERRGLNRLHHRILYFVGRNPNQAIGDLLTTLAISKQALNLPLRQLIEMDFVQTAADPADRRVKRLSLTLKGQALEGELTGAQIALLGTVFDSVRPTDVEAWFGVMTQLADRGVGNV